MTFINLSLLFGLGLAAVPVILHLMMRSRPKQIEFPALRLLEKRRSSNARRMKLRHLLLLLLRVGVLLALVLALTRPSLPPARYGLVWYEWLLLLAAIVGGAAYYRVRSRSQDRDTAAAWQQQELRSRLRVRALLGSLLAALVCVGLPWGLRVRAEIETPRNDLAEDIPVAAVFIFDTSHSMDYRHESLTRLEQARQTASEHLAILPGRSRVAITGLEPDGEVVFQADLAGAQSRLESLRTRPRVDSINHVLRTAVEAQREDQLRVREELGTAGSGDLYSREIYIFTDMAASAWRIPDDRGLRDLLLEHQDVRVYLLDSSVPNPVNLALTQLKLSAESVVERQPVAISLNVTGTKQATQSTVIELLLVGEDGTEIPAGTAPVQLQNGAATARFLIPAQSRRNVQYGIARLSSADPLRSDDVRYFSIAVRPRLRILIVGDSPADWVYLHSLLEPAESRITGDSPYDCQVSRMSRLNRQVLSSYDVVCLINPQQPADRDWTQLLRYVEQGGAMFTILGGEQRLNLDRWSHDDCQSVLPGLLLREHEFQGEPVTLKLGSTHPVSSAFAADPKARTDLLSLPMYRCITVEKASDPRAVTVMHYTDEASRPALLSRRVGEGYSVMLTTAFFRASTDADEWNELVGNWPMLMLTDEIIQYVTGAADQRLNFVTGDEVEIRVSSEQPFEEFRLLRPGLRQKNRPHDSQQSHILIDDADDPGHYRLLSIPDPTVFEAGFAVNLPDEESDLTPIESSDLDDALGKGRYALVTDAIGLRDAVQLGRLGIEVFPVLLGLLILLFCGEHLMANYFYEQEAVVEAAE